MKNAFKFGFLGLAIMVGAAACNSAKKEADQKVDSLESVVDVKNDSLKLADSLDSIGTTVVDTVDSVAKQ